MSQLVSRGHRFGRALAVCGAVATVTITARRVDGTVGSAAAVRLATIDSLRATASHEPFAHVDARGSRARRGLL
jgi:hypothetical protein